MTIQAPFDSIRIHNVLMEGVKEIVGPEDARSLVQQVRPTGDKKVRIFPGLGALERAMEERYGECCGKGVAVRVGRAGFQHGLRQWGELAGMYIPSYQLLPVDRRIREGLQKLAEVFSKQTGMTASVAENEGHWFFKIERNVQFTRKAADEPACYMVIGMLEGFMIWAGRGKYYQVNDFECDNTHSGAYLFTIEKKPDE